MKHLLEYLVPRVVENFGEAGIRMRRNIRAMTHSFRDDRPNLANTFFLSGTMRSGTTWLAEAINYANDYRLLYEPFNPSSVRLCKNFWERQYLRPDNNEPLYLRPAHAILSGDVRNPWIDQYNRCKIVTQRLVKEVRATLMSKWIRENFPQIPIIFLMRHPCAVAVSRSRLGYRTDLRETVFFKQRALMDDHLAQFQSKILWANTTFERHVVDWCIEHYVPLAQLERNDARLVFYEDLVTKPREELSRLFEFLRRPFDDSIMNRLNKPSASSRRRRNSSTGYSSHEIIEGWRKYTSTTQISAARRILEIFGLEHIYGGQSLPQTTTAGNLNSRASTQQR